MVQLAATLSFIKRSDNEPLHIYSITIHAFFFGSAGFPFRKLVDLLGVSFMKLGVMFLGESLGEPKGEGGRE